MYVSMNPEQRDAFEHEVNQQEREIEYQERIGYLEEEIRSKANIVDELKSAKSNVAGWRKISTFLMVLMFVMLMLLLVAL